MGQNTCSSKENSNAFKGHLKENMTTLNSNLDKDPAIVLGMILQLQVHDVVVNAPLED
jgi:hypothetical protein